MMEEPSAGQIRDQLARIVASSQFKKAATQAKLLSFVVEKGLAGTPIMEVDIGCELDPHYNPESNKVRSNASIVREKLQVYYQSEGVNDLVRIELPPGPNYKPRASYHSDATVIRRYRQGLDLMRKATPDALEQADLVFWLVRDECPSFLPVYVSHAECRLLLSVAKTLFDLLDKRDIHHDTDAALGYLKGLEEESQEELPRLHLIAGAARLLRGEISQARTEFERAIQKDFHETSVSLWYAAYLFLVIEDYESALEITYAKRAAEPESFAVRIVGAVLLYADGQYRAAADWVADVYEREGGEMYEPLIIGLAHLAVKNYDIAYSAFFFASEMKSKEKARLDRYFLATQSVHGDLPSAPSLDRFPGLMIMALVGSGKVTEAKRRLDKLYELTVYKALDMTIGYMALERWGRCLVWYSRWATQNQFLLYWIEKLPLFDPLVKHPRFAQVQRRAVLAAKN